METKTKENIDSQEPPVKKVKIMEQYECTICGASFETVQQLKNCFSIYQDENKEEEYDPSNEAEDDPFMQKALENALKVITFHLNWKSYIVGLKSKDMEIMIIQINFN